MKSRLFLASLLVLAACATPTSFTGRTEADLRSAMGAPAAEYANPDGSRTLAYTTGRMGTQAYMAEVAGDGRVRAVRAARNDATFNRIHAGMRQDEVLRLIGPPQDTMQFERRHEDSWEYLFFDTWGYMAYFYVDFNAAGVVVSKTTRRIESNRSDNN